MAKQCTWLSTGNWNCDAYDRFFIGLPAALQVIKYNYNFKLKNYYRAQQRARSFRILIKKYFLPDFTNYLLSENLFFQAARALTIISLFFNLIGMCASIVGLDCTTVAADQPGTKHKCVSDRVNRYKRICTKVDTSISHSELSHTRRSDASDKREENTRVHFGANLRVSSPRLYRFKLLFSALAKTFFQNF